VKNKRPVNLDLRTMKFPAMAIASILHRLSGIALFLLMPFFLYFLALSLKTQETFIQAKFMLAQGHWKILFWVFSAALIYHFLAGIRHMMMDLGYGEELESGRFTAVAVIVLAVILSILLGIWIW